LSAERGKTLPVHIEDPDGKPLPGAIASGMTELFPIAFALKKGRRSSGGCGGCGRRGCRTGASPFA